MVIPSIFSCTLFFKSDLLQPSYRNAKLYALSYSVSLKIKELLFKRDVFKRTVSTFYNILSVAENGFDFQNSLTLL